MKIYIDSEFKCHTTNEESSRLEYETSFFDDKCNTFIEGYRFVPTGKTWVREDGVTFPGEMITPWKPYIELAAAQAQYELDIAEAGKSYQEGVNSV